MLTTIDTAAVLAGETLNASQIVMAEFAVALSRFRNLGSERSHIHDSLWSRMARLIEDGAAEGIDASTRRKMVEIVAAVEEELCAA